MIDLQIRKLEQETDIHLLVLSPGDTLIGNYIGEENGIPMYEYLFEVVDDGDKYSFHNYLEKQFDSVYHLNPDHIMIKTDPPSWYRNKFIEFLVSIELENIEIN